jgi:chromosome partitioning protein
LIWGAKILRNGAHVIVVGNEKGGSGKSTTAFHLAIYLLHAGYRVATIDVDGRQQTLTHLVRNRRTHLRDTGRALPNPLHFHLPSAWGDSIRENQKAEFDIFRRSIGEVENKVDYLVIDTPGFDTNLTRLAHSLADTLVTPVNDSLIDINVLARVDGATGLPVETSHYARLVQRARSERMAIDGASIDWVLVRNRISMLASRNARQVQVTLDGIATRFGCRMADWIAERVIFRSLFATGMTVFDPLDDDAGGDPTTSSHLSARQEYRNLVAALNLPIRGLEPAEAMRLSA